MSPAELFRWGTGSVVPVPLGGNGQATETPKQVAMDKTKEWPNPKEEFRQGVGRVDRPVPLGGVNPHT